MKEQHLHLRVGSAEKALVRCAAREAGVSASRFVLRGGRGRGRRGSLAAEPFRGAAGAVGGLRRRTQRSGRRWDSVSQVDGGGMAGRAKWFVIWSVRPVPLDAGHDVEAFECSSDSA